jgi:pimeloyl-ACP methyl ester carboxylesterase
VLTPAREDVPIILLSGMAADERLFGPQLAQFTIAPEPSESVRCYAARIARHANPGRPCIIGGASFGGIVALEMAHHLDARACVLIGSIRSQAELPWRWRVAQPLAMLGPDAAGSIAGILARVGSGLLNGGTTRRLHRLSLPEAAFVRWAMCAVCRWRARPIPKRVPVFHIHGANDPTLPVALTRPDVTVPAGGHALTLFSPEAVNAFLTDVLRRVSGPHASTSFTTLP